MSANTKIEWTEATWSPVTGCTRVSDGCLNCYIERTPPFRMSHRRFDRDGIGGTTGVLLHPGRLGIPLKWRKPKRIFVCSMADLFHAEVPDEFIARVWHVMRMAPDHTFQVLTKRHDRMRSLLNSVDFRELVFGLGGVGRGQANGHLEHYRQWPVPNVWLGVSTENQQWANIRIPVLLDTPAAVRFISAEPLLGPIDLIGQGGNMVGAGMYALPDRRSTTAESLSVRTTAWRSASKVAHSSIGSSSAVSPGLAPGRCTPPGRGISNGSAPQPMSRSCSSSGATGRH